MGEPGRERSQPARGLCRRFVSTPVVLTSASPLGATTSFSVSYLTISRSPGPSVVSTEVTPMLNSAPVMRHLLELHDMSDTEDRAAGLGTLDH